MTSLHDLSMRGHFFFKSVYTECVMLVIKDTKNLQSLISKDYIISLQLQSILLSELMQKEINIKTLTNIP